MLEDDEMYCHECGTKQEAEEGEVQVGDTHEFEGKKCIHCGENIEADSTFCPFCGKEQKAETAQKIVAKVPEIVKDHLSRVLLNQGKWIATIIIPQKYPKSAFQLLTNKEEGFVINVALEKAKSGEDDLITRIMQSSYYAKFVVDDPNENDFFANMKLNNKEDAIKLLSGLLHDIYEQPFNVAPRYETDLGEDKTVVQAVDSKLKKCIHCGEGIETDSMFCPFCGKSQVVKDVKSEAPQEQIHAETPQIEDSKADEPLQEEDPTYKWEEEKKSKTWLWVLLTILAVAGAVFLYFSVNEDSMEAVEGENIEYEDSVATKLEVEDDAPKDALAFIEEFYKGNLQDDTYIKSHVTASVLTKLKNDYDYDCPSNDCLATWVLTAYPAGADMNLEEGPSITATDQDGVYKLDFWYSFYDGYKKGFETRTVYLAIAYIGGRFLISDYLIEEKKADNTEEEEFDEAAMMDNLAKRNNEANGFDENGE